MSSPNNKTQDVPQPPPTVMPSTSLRPALLDDSQSLQGDDDMSSRSTPTNSRGSNFSPADCRTLQKILHDVRSPSPLSTTSYFDETPARKLDLTATPTDSIGEERPAYEDEGFDRGDEREQGYEDEDDSMELSDGEDAFGIDGKEAGDTIEDVMNLPGKTAPSAPVQDYSSFYTRDKPTPDEPGKLQLRRASIEKDLMEQRRQQECASAIAATDGVFDTDALNHGVSSQVLAIDEVSDLKTLQEDIGMHPVEDEQLATSALGSFEAYCDLPRAQISSRNVRRASEDALPVSTSFIAFPSPARAVVQTPNGRHIDFAPSDTTPDTPLTNTPSYFDSRQFKDNTPHKCRRSASSPTEIIDLAREARVEEEEAAEQRELINLDQFRDMDLAPIETVMEGGPAGDLIMCGTPAKASDKALFLQSASDTVDSEMEDWIDLQRPQSRLPSPRRPNLLIEQDEENDADVEESDSTSDPEQQQPAGLPRYPTFITVISMIPAAIFWATAASIVDCSSKAFDTLIEKLTGLKV
ncbi:uncharacterized protein J4E78_010492 [Alternaria triticimaculans]|uniref:uncharacterized protein n=1 Tax=Alternaria triticimaculans TaxID=297637 RepID=UPI0020C38538|nr:uncharacterized protein J4E78_010492 [Alternaria triticimaculans]KAI4641016.1 hypothetical protein J4E78_010492 [Alternaria triticimaculans]